jgi:hypothetical protein
MGGAKDSIDRVKSSLQEASKQAGNLYDNLSKTIDGVIGLNDLNEMYKKISGSIEGATTQSVEFLNKLKASTEVGAAKLTMIALAGAGISGVSSEFSKLAGSASGATAQVDSLSAMLDKIPVAKGVTKVISNVMKLGESAKNMENNFLKQAAAGGNLNEVINALGGAAEKSGKPFAKLDNLMTTYYKQTSNIGIATGLTSGQVKTYYDELQKIPGILKQTVNGTHALEAAIKVARGSFQDIGTVTQAMGEMFLKYRTNADAALGVISKMHRVAQALNLPMDQMSGFTKATAEQFKYLGDNTKGAVNLIAKLGTALKDELGPETMKELVSTVAKGIGDLSMAQKAFLGGQTGGAGGLKGAFEIDLLLEKGKVDEVYEKVQTSLAKQIGGPIVTLEEASRSESAAAQMAKQVQLLTSGPLKMVDSAQQAYKLLEAMKTGTGAADALTKEAPEKALEAVTERGNKIIERQYNKIIAIKNKLDFAAEMQAITAQEAVRQTVGFETKWGVNLFAGISKLEEKLKMKKGTFMTSREEASVMASKAQVTAKTEGGVQLESVSEVAKGVVASIVEMKRLKEQALGTGAKKKTAAGVEVSTAEDMIKAIPSEKILKDRTGKDLIEDFRRQHPLGGAATGAAIEADKKPTPTQNINIDVTCSSCGKRMLDASANGVAKFVIRHQSTSNQGGAIG